MNDNSILEIINRKIDGVEFKINGQSAIVEDSESIQRIIDHLGYYMEYRERIGELIEIFNTYLIDKSLYVSNVCSFKNDKGDDYFEFEIDLAYVFGDLNSESIHDNRISENKIINVFGDRDVFTSSTIESVKIHTLTKEDMLYVIDYIYDNYIVEFLKDVNG